jgi:hypothetical protein
MANSQIGIYIVNKSLQDNILWKKLIRTFAVIGSKYEIHCWKNEVDEIKMAMQYGKEKRDALEAWEYGTIIEGVIDDKFIEMLDNIEKPVDTELCNKMTPFFTIFLKNGFSSEHYGTEIHIYSEPADKIGFMALLEELKEYADIHEL